MPTTRLMQFSPDGRDNLHKSPFQGVSSAHFLRLIEERGQIGFWTSELATSAFTFSIGLYRVLGICPAISLGFEELITIIHPDDRPAHHDMCETLRSGHAIDREFRIIRPDGTLRWIQNKAEVIVDEKGRPTRVVGVMVDVTEQRSARRSVEEGWARYRTLLKSVAVTEMTMMANGELNTADGWQKLTGQTAEEAVGWGWLQALHPDDRELGRAPFFSPAKTAEVRSGKYRIFCADGRYRWFLLHAAPNLNGDGTIREWTGALFVAAEFSSGSDPHHDENRLMLVANNLRAARALLNWRIDDLAKNAGVSISSIRRLEDGKSAPFSPRIQQAVVNAFSRAGVSFERISDDHFILRSTSAK